jgi:hypothetical protein
LRKKTWELRSRGRIALIQKGSGTVIGVAELVGTLPNLSRSSLISNVKKHRTFAARIPQGHQIHHCLGSTPPRARISQSHIGTLLAL